MTQAQTNPFDNVLPTAEQLVSRTPEKYQPFVSAMAPGVLALARLGMIDAWAWLDRVIKGDGLGAYVQIVKTLDEAAFRAQWDADDASLDAHNAANADRIAAGRQALSAALRGLAVAGSLLIAF